jgi:Alpha/beta hydrolase
MLQAASAVVDSAESTVDALVRERAAADDMAVRAAREAVATLLDGRSQNRSFLQWFASVVPASNTSASNTLASNTSSAVSVPGVGIQDLPLGQTPQEVAAWWDAHGMQHTWLKSFYPEALRNLDGIPALDRDEMNRTYLASLKASTKNEIDELSEQMRDLSSRSPKHQTLRSRVATLRSRLAAIETLEQVLNDPKYPDRLLLLMDFSGGIPKAAVATGNIDTANHVAVITGGVSTTVDGERGDDGKYTGGW